MQFVKLKMVQGPEKAAPWMAEHKAWLQKGFDDAVFLTAGNLQGESGGGILVQGLSADVLRQRLAEDPFVAHGIVEATVTEFLVARADARLAFLVEGTP